MRGGEKKRLHDILTASFVCLSGTGFRRLPMDTQKELIAEYDRELASTRKMLDAIPDDADLNWKANPKCMTLGRLAAHVAETAGEWGINTLSKDGLKFDMGSYKPWNPASKAEILQKFD